MKSFAGISLLLFSLYMLNLWSQYRIEVFYGYLFGLAGMLGVYMITEDT